MCDRIGCVWIRAVKSYCSSHEKPSSPWGQQTSQKKDLRVWEVPVWSWYSHWLTGKERSQYGLPVCLLSASPWTKTSKQNHHHPTFLFIQSQQIRETRLNLSASSLVSCLQSLYFYETTWSHGRSHYPPTLEWYSPGTILPRYLLVFFYDATPTAKDECPTI